MGKQRSRVKPYNRLPSQKPIFVENVGLGMGLGGDIHKSNEQVIPNVVLQDPPDPAVKQQGGSGLESEPNLHCKDFVYIMSVPDMITRVFPDSGPSEGLNDVIFQFLMNENDELMLENVLPFIENDILAGINAFLTK